jgi:glycosyltransferase involved in cell wall biosynthesis
MITTSRPDMSDPATGYLDPVAPDVGPPRPAPGSRSGPVRLWLIHRAFRLGLAAYALAMAVAKRLGPRRRSPGGAGHDILLTGTFHSDNWLAAHVRPLAMSRHCARVRVVSVSPVPRLDKVQGIRPPAWLVRALGAVPARLLTFFAVGLWTRPHIVGGFHLLVNGLAAALLARLTGARSLYFCVGGPTEVKDGGILGESRLFTRMETPDAQVERRLLQAVGSFDLVVAMGTQAVRFFRQRGVSTSIHVIPGGLDTSRFHPSPRPPTTDLILVARLVPIKQVDLFLRTVALLRQDLPGLTATVVGDGPLRGSLERLAQQLGLDGCVSFVGHRPDVEAWLNRASVFVLTSASEGLALSLMEAMLSGVPAVVPQVGDLADLVEHGVNGYLVTQPAPDAFAEPIMNLLSNPDRRAMFSDAARRAALRHDLCSTSRFWDAILATQETTTPRVSPPTTSRPCAG